MDYEKDDKGQGNSSELFMFAFQRLRGEFLVQKLETLLFALNAPPAEAAEPSTSDA